MTKQIRIPIRVASLEKKSLMEEQHELYGEIKHTTEQIKTEIEQYCKKEENLSRTLLFLGDFAELDIEKQTEILKIANQYKEENKIEDIIIQVSTDNITKGLLKFWRNNKLDKLELQINTNPLAVLEKNSGFYKNLKKLVRRIKWNRMQISFQMPVGMPELSSIDEQNIAKMLLKLKPKLVRIYPILVIRDTNLEEEWKKQEYEALTITQAIARCKDLVYECYQAGVLDICVGIPNEGKVFEGDRKIVAGPFHPDLAQMVESSIWYDSVVEKIKKMETKVKVAKIKVNPENVDKVIGFDGENVKKLKDIYDVELQVVGDEKIKSDKSEMIIVKTYEDILEEEKRK